MKKYNALSAIIEQISGHDDDGIISDLCDIVENANYCNGINCDDCPFNSARNMDDAVQEMEQVANT